MKLTEWYPPHIKPKRKGIYITAVDPHVFHDQAFWFQYWSGKYWKTRSNTILGAEALKEFQSGFQEVYWKGIAK